MIDARHRWVFPEPYRLDPALRAAARELGVGTFAATVMARRGIADPVTLAAFLGPAAAGLNDPRLLPDAPALVERVARARDRGERVMVFGDFDADGLTGLAQLVLAFRRLGIQVTPYVPSRLEEGHGLSLAAVDAAAGDGITLIVTVDTGSTSVAEVAAARARSIDVIVTDHHRLPEGLPAAVALLNPQRADSAYPDRGLSGSGVALTLAPLLVGEVADCGAGAAPPSPSPGCCSASWPMPRPTRCRSRSSPSSGPSRTSRRCSARTARSRSWGWTRCGPRHGPGSPRCSPGQVSSRRLPISRRSAS